MGSDSTFLGDFGKKWDRFIFQIIIASLSILIQNIEEKNILFNKMKLNYSSSTSMNTEGFGISEKGYLYIIEEEENDDDYEEHERTLEEEEEERQEEVELDEEFEEELEEELEEEFEEELEEERERELEEEEIMLRALRQKKKRQKLLLKEKLKTPELEKKESAKEVEKSKEKTELNLEQKQEVKKEQEAQKASTEQKTQHTTEQQASKNREQNIDVVLPSRDILIAMPLRDLIHRLPDSLGFIAGTALRSALDFMIARTVNVLVPTAATKATAPQQAQKAPTTQQQAPKSEPKSQPNFPAYEAGPASAPPSATATQQTIGVTTYACTITRSAAFIVNKGVVAIATKVSITKEVTTYAPL